MPSGLILIAGAFFLPFAGNRLRPLLLLGLPLLTLVHVWSLEAGAGSTVAFLDYQLTPLKIDSLSRLFATIFAIAAAAGGLYAMNQKRVIELVAAYVYAGAAIGVVLAGDLITVFVFWELMAVASTMVIWSTGTDAAYRASMRYMLVHLLGGVILMAGIVWQINDTGSVAFTAMRADSPAGWLILIGFLLNAGAPPLSAWLPDAYPEASYSGTVFLSTFTTKTAIYVLIRGFPGEEILIFIGLYMIFYGIVYALLENDIRRVLAYSIVNQVGFMITGIGIGTDVALNGAAAHAFVHIIYKSLLMMSAGSVIVMTGRRKCSELGGLFRSMPLTTACCVIGALATAAFPLTSGFISKAMISQSAAGQGLMAVWMLLAAASAAVVLHAGLKLPWFVFFGRDSGLRPAEPPLNMRAAMVVMAAFSIAIGVQPDLLYAMLPYPVDFAPYTTGHVLKTLQSLSFSALAFFLLLPAIRRGLSSTLDLDWFYRRAGARLAGALAVLFSAAIKGFMEAMNKQLSGFARLVAHLHGPQGAMARTAQVGSMAQWMLVVLCIFLVVFLLWPD